MKNIVYLIAAVLLFTGCNDVEPLDPGLVPINNGPAFFTADLDGMLFTGNTVEATLNNDGLIMEGEQGDEAIGFQIFNPAVGTFNVDTTSSMTGALLVVADEPANLAWIASTGSVIITDLDETAQIVSGTFSGTAQELFGSAPDRVITNGIFENIPYTTDAGVDEATATVNGAPFVADLFPVAEVNNQQTIVFDSGLDERIAITVPSNVTAGTYPIEAFGGMTVAMYAGYYENDSINNGARHDSVANSGQIIITDRTGDTLTGTFEFTAVDPANPTAPVMITNGAFIVEIL